MNARSGTAPLPDERSRQELCAEIEALRARVGELESGLASRRAMPQPAPGEEQRLDDFAGSFEGWFWETDAELRFTYFSPSVERVTGVAPQWHYGKTREEIGIPRSVSDEQWQAHLQALRRREPFRDFTYQRLGPRGATWLQVSGVPVFDDAGDFRGYRGVAHDVTQRIEAERRNSQLVSAVANLNDVFVLWDADDRLVVASSRFHELNARVAGWTEPGTRFEDHARATVEAGLFPDAAGREQEYLASRCRQHREAGSAFEVDYAYGRCLLVKEHRLPDGCTATVGVDITERKRAEAEIRRTRDRLHAESVARASAEQALRNSEARYRVLVEHAPEAVCVMDMKTQRFVDANRNASRLFKLDRERLLATGPLAMSAALQAGNLAAEQAMAPHLEQVLAGEHPVFEWLYTDAEGREVPCEVRLSLLPDAVRTLVRSSVIDISERKQAQRSREWQARLNDIVRRAQTLFIESNATDAVFDALLEGLVELTGSEYGFIGQVLRDADGAPYLKTQSITDVSWDEESRRFYEQHAPDGLEFRNLDSLFGAVLSSGDVVIANDAVNDPRAGGAPPGHPPLRAFLGLPFYAGGQMVGIIGLANRAQGYSPSLVAELGPFLASCASLLQAHRERTTRAGAEEALALHRKALEQTVQARTARLAAANDEIKRFTYIVSHDLRAPLVNIKGFSAELRDDLERLREAFDAVRPALAEDLQREVGSLFDESIPEAAGFIDASVTRMDRQIQALLRYSRIGERELVPQALDLNAIVASCVDSIQHQIDASGAQVHIAPLPPLFSDALAIEQILGNLIDNAVKYLDPERAGRIEVDGAERDRQVVLRVADNGRGIAERDRERVFQVFTRAAPQKIPGEGMGLAFVQVLVRRLGGRIALQSTAGEGTTFTVTLPLAALPATPAAEQTP